jgi:hypothetical protein
MPVRQLGSTIQRMGSDTINTSDTSIHQYVSTCKMDVPRAITRSVRGLYLEVGQHVEGSWFPDHLVST